MIIKMFSPKTFDEKICDLTYNTAIMAEKSKHTIHWFLRKRQFFSQKIFEKSRKIVIITLIPVNVYPEKIDFE
jgi:hypothetical protein